MPDSTRRRAGKVHSYYDPMEHASEEQRLRIAEAAYFKFKADQQGCASGFELHDCVFYPNRLEAERELDQAS
jgi:hypothetical protein